MFIEHFTCTQLKEALETRLDIVTKLQANNEQGTEYLEINRGTKFSFKGSSYYLGNVQKEQELLVACVMLRSNSFFFLLPSPPHNNFSVCPSPHVCDFSSLSWQHSPVSQMRGQESGRVKSLSTADDKTHTSIRLESGPENSWSGSCVPLRPGSMSCREQLSHPCSETELGRGGCGAGGRSGQTIQAQVLFLPSQ